MPRIMFHLLAAVCLAVLTVAPARAQGLIRDAEIEYSLRRVMAPVANAAGLGASNVRVFLINDSSMNAFVADAQTIFVHTGLLLKLQDTAQLQAVLAHELAHITNGHLTRRAINRKSAGQAALAGLIVGLGAAVAGSPDVGLGLAAGSGSVAQRVFFTHTRAEEASADQAGARYMIAAGVSPQSMVEVLEIFRGQEALNVSRQDPYVLTHPLTQDRLRAVKGFASAYPKSDLDQSDTDYWFARARGKLGAFTQNPSYTLRRIKSSDTSDLALMRRAVAYHRKPDIKAAIEQIDKLVARRPQDPFAHELRGQILLESRRFDAAIQAYARAVQLAPNEALIRAGYGRALLSPDTAASNRKALKELQAARSRDPHDPRMLRDLAVAYARAGNNGMASLSTAERYALSGRLKDAGVHAKRAAGLLPHGSPGWNRAQDILHAAELAAKRR